MPNAASHKYPFAHHLFRVAGKASSAPNILTFDKIRMGTADTIRTIAGIAGNATSLCLYLSPLPTFYKVWNWKSTRLFSGLPYLAAMLSCMLCVCYGSPLVRSHNTLVVTINAAGFVLEAMYCAMFFTYSDRKERIRLFKILAAIVTFMAADVVSALALTRSREKRSLIVGFPAGLIGICIWTAYACMRFDTFILVPNGLGAVLGGLQLVLYPLYYNSTTRDYDDARARTEQGVDYGTTSDPATLLILKP